MKAGSPVTPPPESDPEMSCKLWIEKALPFLEGTLPAAAARGYAAHVGGCPVCRAEVEAGRKLIRALRRLEDPELSPEAVARFDTAVLGRVARGTPASAFIPAPEGRAAAAAAIAARSRQAGRPVFAPLSPLPSLTLASLGLAAASMAIALLYGEWIVRALRMSFALAFAALSGGGAWFAERVGIRIVEVAAAARILGRVMGNPSLWGEALKQLVAVHGPELLTGAVLAAALFGLLALVLRREQRKVREVSRS